MTHKTFFPKKLFPASVLQVSPFLNQTKDKSTCCTNSTQEDPAASLPHAMVSHHISSIGLYLRFTFSHTVPVSLHQHWRCGHVGNTVLGLTCIVVHCPSCLDLNLFAWRFLEVPHHLREPGILGHWSVAEFIGMPLHYQSRIICECISDILDSFVIIWFPLADILST